MRTLLLLSLYFLLLHAGSNCPVGGNDPKESMQKLDSLKNRSTAKALTGTPEQVKQYLDIPNDANHWKNTSYVSVTGYLILAKYGGPETCECDSKDSADLDYHLELADSPNATDKEAMICEVTRYTKKDVPYTLEQLEKMKGSKITVEGFLFYDAMHTKQAVSTAPNNKNDWRNTCWEVHPVFKITKAQN